MLQNMALWRGSVSAFREGKESCVPLLSNCARNPPHHSERTARDGQPGAAAQRGGELLGRDRRAGVGRGRFRA